jgi:hypothetical protein
MAELDPTFVAEPTLGERLAGAPPGGGQAELPNPLMFLIPGFAKSFAPAYVQGLTQRRLRQRQELLFQADLFSKALESDDPEFFLSEASNFLGIPVNERTLKMLAKRNPPDRAAGAAYSRASATRNPEETVAALVETSRKPLAWLTKLQPLFREFQAQRQAQQIAELGGPPETVPQQIETTVRPFEALPTEAANPILGEAGARLGFGLRSIERPSVEVRDVPFAQAQREAQLAALRTRVQQLSQFPVTTDQARLSRDAALKRMEQQIERLEEEVGAGEVRRRVAELKRIDPTLSGRERMQEALLGAQAAGFRLPSHFEKFLPESPSKTDLALRAAAGDQTAELALDKLTTRERAVTQVDLALRAAQGEEQAVRALRFLRPEENEAFIRPVIEQGTQELVLVGIDKRTGAQRFTTRTGIKANVSADVISQLLANYGLGAPGQPAAPSGAPDPLGIR